MASGQLEKILELSGAMLRLSEQQQWEQVAVLEAQRRGIIREYFANPTDRAADLAASIRKILELDSQLITRGRRAQTEVLRSLQGLAKGKHAAQAYEYHKSAD